jgi:hypothetical protein
LELNMTPRRLITSLCLTGALAATAVPAASAATGTSVPQATSQNWSGYVAGGSSTATQFSSVAGSWVQPSASCTAGNGYSAFWVGLGGSSNQSQSLEQVGTQADCTGNGQASYYAWYELVPAGQVRLDLAIHPGDHISARVTVNGTTVAVSLSDQTTGASVTKNLQMSSPDTSSAEWIAEAPSTCDQAGNCQALPLANFGTVSFTNASATANGHSGPISDPNWTVQAVQLSGAADSAGYGPTGIAYSQSSAGAQPSSLSTDGGSFSVSWQGTGGAASSSTGGSGSGGGYGYGGYVGGYGYGDGGYGGYGYGGAYGYGGYGGGAYYGYAY